PPFPSPLPPPSPTRRSSDLPHPVRPGDMFVLCSDGLSGPVSDEEIGGVAALLPPEEACQFLVALANLRGGPDNITVQIVREQELDRKSTRLNSSHRTISYAV